MKISNDLSIPYHVRSFASQITWKKSKLSYSVSWFTFISATISKFLAKWL